MKVVIVTTKHVSYNPRVVKEADTLADAGYEVVVYAFNYEEYLHRIDINLLKGRKWKLKTINFRKKGVREYLFWLYSGIRQKIIGRILSRITLAHGIAELAYGRVTREYIRLVKKEKANLYIAHHVDALAPAYFAAKKYNSKFAFDVEDLHDLEFSSGDSVRTVKQIEYIQGKFLPECNYVTVASPCFVDHLKNVYSVKSAVSVMNVFPLEIISQSDRRYDKNSDLPSIYWYSQVIGYDRGIEIIVEVFCGSKTFHHNQMQPAPIHHLTRYSMF